MRTSRYKTIIISLLLSVWLALGVRTSAEESQNSSSFSCGGALLRAVSQKTRHDFPKKIRHFLAAFNDLQCTPHDMGDGATALMANVTVVVDIDSETKLLSGNYRYGIFHIHFTQEGEWIPTEGSTLPEWIATNDFFGWKKEWCALIRSVYPQELKEQKCESE